MIQQHGTATTEKISVVRREGNRDVNHTLQFYNLDAVISVGYRVRTLVRWYAGSFA
jgi:hypothetical protein